MSKMFIFTPNVPSEVLDGEYYVVSQTVIVILLCGVYCASSLNVCRFRKNAFNPKKWRRIYFSQQKESVFIGLEFDWWGVAVSGKWCQIKKKKKLSCNDSCASPVYERGRLKSEWCAPLLLHLKSFMANLCVKATINQTWRWCNLSFVFRRVLCQ